MELTGGMYVVGGWESRMRKFRCVCGQVISTSGESRDEWLILQEQAFGQLWDMGETFEEVFHAAKRMYLCPKSGHLWVFWSGLGKAGTCYYPGSNAPIDRNEESRGSS